MTNTTATSKNPVVRFNNVTLVGNVILWLSVIAITWIEIKKIQLQFMLGLPHSVNPTIFIFIQTIPVVTAVSIIWLWRNRYRISLLGRASATSIAFRGFLFVLLQWFVMYVWLFVPSLLWSAFRPQF